MKINNTRLARPRNSLFSNNQKVTNPNLTFFSDPNPTLFWSSHLQHFILPIKTVTRFLFL